jgi:5-methylcytosine-specific restriction endonuclease McrA
VIENYEKKYKGVYEKKDKRRMRRIGKKSIQWRKDRAKLVKKALLEGKIEIINGVIVGRCEECGRWKELEPDHKRKRSLGGSNDESNIEWICRECHNKRDNMGDPNNKKIKAKKADWMIEHQCINCKKKTRQLICEHCGKLSVKT